MDDELTGYQLLRAVKQAIRDRYAWPGGYPLAVDLGGEEVCMNCTQKYWADVCRAVYQFQRTGRRGDYYPSPPIVYLECVTWCCLCQDQIEAYHGSPDYDDAQDPLTKMALEYMIQHYQLACTLGIDWRAPHP